MLGSVEPVGGSHVTVVSLCKIRIVADVIDGCARARALATENS